MNTFILSQFYKKNYNNKKILFSRVIAHRIVRSYEPKIPRTLTQYRRNRDAKKRDSRRSGWFIGIIISGSRARLSHRLQTLADFSSSSATDLLFRIFFSSPCLFNF